MDVRNQTITEPDAGGDGIILSGAGPHTVANCMVDFSAHPTEGLDELISTVNGAQASITSCILSGSTKGVLCGNGDYPEADKQGRVTIISSCMEHCGRRMPEAQDGVTVTMRNCVIRNWGIENRFDVRCFGAWAHHGAHITTINCRFEQTSFWQTGVWNFVRDMANHIGQAVNDRGIFGLTLKDFLPGVCRGLVATDGGTVRAVACTKNKWWIRVEGQE